MGCIGVPREAGLRTDNAADRKAGAANAPRSWQPRGFPSRLARTLPSHLAKRASANYKNYCKAEHKNRNDLQADGPGKSASFIIIGNTSGL